MAATGHQTNGRRTTRARAVSAAGARHRGPAGRRLAEALDSVERLPILAESRERVIRSTTSAPARLGALVEAVESDVALTLAVMRAANRAKARPVAAVATVSGAIERLRPSGVLAVAAGAPVYDLLESNGGGAELRWERFRLHALATQRCADRVAQVLGFGQRQELAVVALVHDVGRLVLEHLHPELREELPPQRDTPEERLARERSLFGVDHTVVGGVLARRWGLPGSLAAAIEQHHASDASGLAAVVRLADMFAHYTQDGAISVGGLEAAAQLCGIDRPGLRDLLYELPSPRADAPRLSEPCPLSPRELDVLRLLSRGLVYKQIAGEMHLSVSTIRTHLHNVYGKIGAVDRAQAVLAARDRGWI